jgi:hypothetical protein
MAIPTKISRRSGAATSSESRANAGRRNAGVAHAGFAIALEPSGAELSREWHVKACAQISDGEWVYPSLESLDVSTGDFAAPLVNLLIV